MRKAFNFVGKLGEDVKRLEAEHNMSDEECRLINELSNRGPKFITEMYQLSINEAKDQFIMSEKYLGYLIGSYAEECEYPYLMACHIAECRYYEAYGIDVSDAMETFEETIPSHVLKYANTVSSYDHIRNILEALDLYDDINYWLDKGFDKFTSTILTIIAASDKKDGNNNLVMYAGDDIIRATELLSISGGQLMLIADNDGVRESNVINIKYSANVHESFGAIIDSIKDVKEKDIYIYDEGSMIESKIISLITNYLVELNGCRIINHVDETGASLIAINALNKIINTLGHRSVDHDQAIQIINQLISM